MGRRYRKLMAMDEIGRRKGECVFDDGYMEEVCGCDSGGGVVWEDQVGIVRDLVEMGVRATAMKWGISEKRVRRIYGIVYNRVKNRYLRRGVGAFKRVDIRECGVKVGGRVCGVLVVGGDRCSEHGGSGVVTSVSGKRYKIDGILRRLREQREMIRRLVSMPLVQDGENDVGEVVYGKIMGVLIECSGISHKRYARRYFGEMEDDIVQMAVDGKFMATRPVKCMLVKSGIQIGRVLRGIERRFNERFNKEVAEWAAIYSDMIGEGERELGDG